MQSGKNKESISDCVERFLGSEDNWVIYTGFIDDSIRTKVKNNLIDKQDSVTGFAGGLVGRMVGGKIGSIAGKALANQYRETQEFTCDKDDIVAIVDASILKDFKEGLVFTNEGVFFSQTAGVSLYVKYTNIAGLSATTGFFDKLQVKTRQGSDFTWSDTVIPKKNIMNLLAEIINNRLYL